MPLELGILVLGARTGIPYSYYIGEFPFSKFFPPADYEFPCVFLGGIPYKSSDCLIAVTDSYIPRFPNCRIPYIYALPMIPRIARLPVPNSLRFPIAVSLRLPIPQRFPEIPHSRFPAFPDSQLPIPNCLIIIRDSLGLTFSRKCGSENTDLKYFEIYLS